MNPIFQAIGGMQRGQLGNAMNIMQQYQQFRQTFQGNPQEEVMKMLQSGKISQGQLNQVQQMAQQFRQMMG